jgi:hypothetical protein
MVKVPLAADIIVAAGPLKWPVTPEVAGSSPEAPALPKLPRLTLRLPELQRGRS